VRLWDLRQPSTVRVFGGREMSPLEFSPDGALLAFCDRDVCVADIGKGEVVMRRKVENEVFGCHFVGAGEKVVVVGRAGGIEKTELDGGALELVVDLRRSVVGSEMVNGELRVVTSC
jgi:WD40 repeat protein